MTSPQFDAIRRFLAANPTPPGIPLAAIRAAAEMLAAVQKVVSGQWSVVSEPERTHILQPQTAVLPQSTPVIKPESEQVKGKRPLLPLLLGGGLLLAVVAVSLALLLGGGDGRGTTEETPAPTIAVVEDVVETPVGTVRFAEPDGNNLRQYTLSLDDVPVPPAGFHYELWFDFANLPEPENVAEVVVGNGRITYADVLVDSLAINVTGIRISLEPDANDDPVISANVVFSGIVSDAGLAEVEMFAVGD